MNTNETTLKQEILQAVEQGDIAKLYMLEQKVNDTFKQDAVIGYYKNILDLALERLTDTLESKKRMKMEDVQNFATVRALYEYAMEHYHAGKTADAAALFEVLGGITDDASFGDAMRVHTAAANKGIDLDTFLEEYVDMEAVERSGSFYINGFTDKARKLLEDSKEERE